MKDKGLPLSGHKLNGVSWLREAINPAEASNRQKQALALDFEVGGFSGEARSWCCILVP